MIRRVIALFAIGFGGAGVLAGHAFLGVCMILIGALALTDSPN